MTEIRLGLLTMIGEDAGAHVRVTIRGNGQPGQRPLCGQALVNPDEWQSLRELAVMAQVATTIGMHWREQGGVNGALLDVLGEATKP